VGRKPQNSANLAAFLHIIDTSRLAKILRADKTAILHAAAKAEQAVKWLRQFDPALIESVREAA
jgi:antirestriction protein ArdC